MSDSLSKELRVASDTMRGSLRLDRPTQTLHYELELTDVLDDEIVDIKLARSANGPIIAMLGSERSGATTIDNEDLAAVVDGNAQLWLFLASDSARPVKATIEP